MLKVVVEALEGFEKQYDELNEMKANIENEKEVAYAEAKAEIDGKFAVKLEKINEVLESISVSKEVEVEDEIVEDAVEENVAENPAE